jgi:hypothetical protein
MSKKVSIRPVGRESIQGRNQYKIVDGVKVGTTKAPGGTFMFQIQQNKTNGHLAIDLERLVDNKWYAEKEEDVNLPSAWGNSSIWKKKKISRQTELELKYNKKEGFLTAIGFRVDKDDKTRTYLQQLYKVFVDSLNELDLTIMDDELMYEAILQSSFFANSMEEINNTPGARFYISHVDEEQELIANKRKRKIEAIAALNDLMEKYSTKLYKVAVVLQIVNGSVNEDIVKNKLYDYLDEPNFNSARVEDRIARFLDLYEQVTSENVIEKEKFEVLFFAQQLINYRVINDFKGRYVWSSKSGTNLEELGRTKNEYLDFLSSSNNTEYIEELKQELESKI